MTNNSKAAAGPKNRKKKIQKGQVPSRESDSIFSISIFRLTLFITQHSKVHHIFVHKKGAIFIFPPLN
jgi:hypothetical protein